MAGKIVIGVGATATYAAVEIDDGLVMRRILNVQSHLLTIYGRLPDQNHSRNIRKHVKDIQRLTGRVRRKHVKLGGFKDQLAN